MLIASALVLATAASATPAPHDRSNIALSTAVVQRVGDGIWPGWSAPPFQIDLLTESGPVLVNVRKPFTPPKFPKDLEATLMLDTGPIIVIGQPRFTQAATPIRWSVTLLHEHFHQWQYSWDGYQNAVKGLGLSHGSNSGMWMLNYAFPYADANVGAAYNRMANSLAGALDALHGAGFDDALRSYLSARDAFKALLTADDYKYFAFQCWQEGVARYTEITVARSAVEQHLSDPSFLTSGQAAALLEDSDQTYESVLTTLRTRPLSDDKRVNFYAIGAGEALLLDRVTPGWRQRYLDPRMDLSLLFVR